MLGPLRAVRDGVEIPVGAAKLRALAAALVVNAPAGVPASELVAALWGERPPSSAHKTLQTYVMQLRRLLGSSAVLTEDRRYHLGLEVRTDVQQFEALIGEARALGDPQRRAVILARALSLWRGDPYAELDDWTGGDRPGASTARVAGAGAGAAGRSPHRGRNAWRLHR